MPREPNASLLEDVESYAHPLASVMADLCVSASPRPRVFFNCAIALLAAICLPQRSAIAIDRSLVAQKESSTIESIKRVAKEQNAILVEYSIFTDEFSSQGDRRVRESELSIWAIAPTGKITLRRVDLKPLWQQQNTSLAKLVTNSFQPICAESNHNKGIIRVNPNERDCQYRKLRQLHQILIEPIQDFLPTEPIQTPRVSESPRPRVIFIPQGELFRVPFAALQDAKGIYAIAKYSIATVPSIEVLDLLAKRQPRRGEISGEDVLVVGNPTIPQVPPQQPLPGAEEEAKAIAQIFDSQALIGDEATETAVTERMPKARIIHLGTQNLTGNFGDIPGGLALAPSSRDDGWLTAPEILKLKLNADLVVASGGDTALGKITDDGVIGLSRAFLASGSRSFIGSLWAVPDSSTGVLMAEFYQQLKSNRDRAAALRQAMLATMKKYPEPMDWAAFTLIGVP